MINAKYNSQITEESLQNYCDPYLVARIYKILPLKEEEKDWRTYVENLNQELLGADEIFLNNAHFISIVHKLESLLLVNSHKDYRRLIFECISVAKTIPSKLNKEGYL
jgi:hypothetical protein